MNEIRCSRCGRFNPPTNTKCQFCLNQLTPPSQTPTNPKSGKKNPPPPISSQKPTSLPNVGRTSTGGSNIVPTSRSMPTGQKPSTNLPVSHTQSNKPLSPLPHELTKLGPPSIEGTVVDSREIQIDKKDLARAIVDGIFNMILLPISPTVAVGSIMASKNRPKEKTTIYIVRIERYDGSIGQVQIEGEFIGGTMEMGDYVSVWGTEKKGVISLNRAFNHEINAEIKV